MKIEHIYTGCLAQGAYYIESDGEAAIVDPLREVSHYIALAEKNNSKIKYIFETHFHADFVSGHIDLAEKTGAKIIYGPTKMKTGFDTIIAEDNQVFTLGKIKIRVIHTPGHTMESSCFLLTDENGHDVALFSGDTLFIGDVGRPDLAQHVISELTEEKLAVHLFHSLREKIMPLNDDIVVYPAHGAGSACGKNLSKQLTDTLGNQKRTNYALNPTLSKDEFVRQLLSGLTPPPAYFPQNVLMNINGYDSIDEVLRKGTKALSVKEFIEMRNSNNAVIIDTRKAENFGKGFIPGSINIGIDGDFAVWVGTLVADTKQPLLLVIDPGRENEVVTRLARVGYDNAVGYLNGGFAAWTNANQVVDTIESVFAKDLPILKEKQSINFLDVRKKSEFDSEHIEGAINMPLDFVNKNLQALDRTKKYYVHCAGGYRSMIFISILRKHGYSNLINIVEGYSGLKKLEAFPITDYVCPTTML
ncbi:MAG: MBL fold metallo-hydrolase [Bacteroidetes bacterium]|nr:MBL fold metallo-hydrolase [Bacteroidota bacterium]